MACAGTLRKYVDGKGYGFIERDDGSGDMFIHIRELINGATEQDMVVGSRLSFDIGQDQRSGKIKAMNVIITSPGQGGRLQGGAMQGGGFQGATMQGGGFQGGAMQGGNFQGATMQGGSFQANSIPAGSFQGG